MAEQLKLPEVARRLGVSEKTARRYIKSGALPSIFIGGAYRVSEEDLLAFVQGAKVTPGGGPGKDLSPRLPLDERGEIEAYLRLVNDQLERALSDEDLKHVVTMLAFAASRLIERTGYGGDEARRLSVLRLALVAAFDPNQQYWNLERKRLEEGLESLEDAPEEARKA